MKPIFYLTSFISWPHGLHFLGARRSLISALFSLLWVSLLSMTPKLSGWTFCLEELSIQWAQPLTGPGAFLYSGLTGHGAPAKGRDSLTRGHRRARVHTWPLQVCWGFEHTARQVPLPTAPRTCPAHAESQSSEAGWSHRSRAQGTKANQMEGRELGRELG